MNRRGFAIVVQVQNVETSIVQGRALRLMSRARTIALTTSSLDATSRDRISKAYDEVVNGDSVAWIGMDRFRSILWMEEGAMPQAQMDRIFLIRMPAFNVESPRMILIEPSRFILKALGPGATNEGLIPLLREMGFTWTPMKVQSLVQMGARPMMIPRPNLKAHLISILEPILGPNVTPILDAYEPLFQQAFITKESNPASNYELMEAYGDRFLGGQYSWLLLETPGVITPDQVTKISSYFQDRMRLAQLAKHLDLVRHIVLAPGQSMDTKIQSDVVEALIAAIGIAWQKASMKGDWAMKMFILKVFSTYFHVEPNRYIVLYENPKTRLKNMVEGYRLDRTKLVSSPPQEQDGEILITVSYNGQPLGQGRVRMQGLYRDTAVDMAEKAAYEDALEKESLQRLVASR